MRLLALLLSALLAAPTLAAQAAQEPAASSPAAESSSAADAKTNGALPVSLGKIREGLERPTATQMLKSELSKAVDREPNFRLEIQERQKIEELLATLDFKSGPTPAGGLYAFEQQRITTPSVDNPLAQPYAAFNQGQLLTILVENLAGKYLAGKAADAITKSMRERAEAAARKDVADAVADYCAGKPNNGAGLEICTTPVAADTTR